jgi:hypothetical protein
MHSIATAATRSPRLRVCVLAMAVVLAAAVSSTTAQAVPHDPELAALHLAPVEAGRVKWVERPRIVMPLRPEEALATWRFEMTIPLVRQLGDKANCGPTAAAMALGAYQGVRDTSGVRVIRDVVGEWTWQAFPIRQLRLAGYDAGITTRHMMRTALEQFEPSVGWQPVEHAWLPLEAWSIFALKKAVAERRPLVVLAEARTLWRLDVPGLHWVVVRGVEAGQVVINDPADGAVARVALAEFWQAWRLPSLYRALPMVSGFEALMPDRSLPIVHVREASQRADSLAPL